MSQKRTIMTATSKSDPARLKRLQLAIREGNKPSRWYDDDISDTRSLYRRRWLALVDISAEIIEHSPDAELVSFSEETMQDARRQLPNTFAYWVEQNPEARARYARAAAKNMPLILRFG
ncbi:MAG TPA: hypothetical protein VIE65_14245 [Methylobacter sp.]|jgi:hypothetical protein